MNLVLNKLSKILKKKIFINDVVYLECNLFGLLYQIKAKKPEYIINDFLNIFVDAIGKKGVLITPSFSYSWGNDRQNKIFDINNTKSTSGVFSEFLRKRRNISRTKDPMFSTLLLSSQKSFNFINSNNSFGKKSVFAYLHKKNATLINFGLDIFDPTFIHYVEQYYDENFEKLNYRKLYKRNGYYSSSRKKHTHYSFLRKNNSQFTFNYKNILNNMLIQKLLYSKKIFSQQLYICKSNDLFDTGINGLKKNKKFFIKKTN